MGTVKIPFAIFVISVLAFVSGLEFVGISVLIYVVKGLCDTVAEILEGKYRGQI